MTARQISLSQFRGQPLKIRFVFQFRGGSFHAYRGDDANDAHLEGWFIDNIRVSDSRLVENPRLVIPDSGNAFTVEVKDVTNPWILSARPVYFDNFPGEWGPSVIVEDNP